MLSILIIDDNPHFSNALSFILENALNDCVENVHIAESGNEAISLIGENDNIDIIFLDVDAPTANSVDVIKNILELKKDVKVIALSFYEELNEKMKLLNAGANLVVQKENITSEILHEIFDKVQ